MKKNETNEINTVNYSLYKREHLHFASLVYHIALVAFMNSFEETFLLNLTKTLDLRSNSWSDSISFNKTNRQIFIALF